MKAPDLMYHLPDGVAAEIGPLVPEEKKMQKTLAGNTICQSLEQGQERMSRAKGT